MRKKIIPILLILLLITNKGVVMGEKPDYKTEIQEKYRQLNLSDGVSKEEAIIIAQNYMIEEGFDRRYILMKPNVEESGFEKYWKVTFRATYAESVKKANIFGLIGMFKWWISIRIDKKTGEIITVGGPDL